MNSLTFNGIHGVILAHEQRKFSLHRSKSNTCPEEKLIVGSSLPVLFCGGPLHFAYDG